MESVIVFEEDNEINLSNEKLIHENELDNIFTNLWLGNLSAATNLKILEDKKISFILTLDCYPLPSIIYELQNIKIKYIQVYDVPDEDLLSHFEDAYEFIDFGLERGVVLVHCYFGISRSATIIISYLMKKKNWTLETAYEYIKTKRKVIRPNPGFMAQLKLFERMKYSLNRDNIQFKIFRLQNMAHLIKKNKIIPENVREVFNDLSIKTLKPGSTVFKCKKCRRVIAKASNLIPHIKKHKWSWEDHMWGHDKETIGLCNKIYFIEPLNWMESASSSLLGRLYCPNDHCRLKFGAFNWIDGCQCPCGTKVNPAFYLTLSKIDKEIFNVKTPI